MRTVDGKGEKPEPLPFDASLIVLVAVPVPLAVRRHQSGVKTTFTLPVLSVEEIWSTMNA
jgi:hypothetical protein